jgi:hypothetical protein
MDRASAVVEEAPLAAVRLWLPGSPAVCYGLRHRRSAAAICEDRDPRFE